MENVVEVVGNVIRNTESLSDLLLAQIPKDGAIDESQCSFSYLLSNVILVKCVFIP